MDVKDISKIVPLIFKLLKDKKFEEMLVEFLNFISKDKIDIDTLEYFDIYKLLQGFFLFLKKSID